MSKAKPLQRKTKKKIIIWCVVIVLIAAIFAAWFTNWIDSDYNSVKTDLMNNYTFYNQNYALEGQTVILGDSITEFYHCENYYGEWTEKSGQVVYGRGIAGDTSEGLLRRLDDNVLNIKPKNLVFHIGPNDICKFWSEHRTAENVRTIIKRAREAGVQNIVLLAVFPITHWKNIFGFFMVNFRTNAKIEKVNAELKKVAEEEGVKWLDITAQLKDSNGRLKEELTYDGVHITKDVYAIMTENIIPLLEM